MPIDALGSLVRRDYLSSLFGALLCIAALLFSIYACSDLEVGPISAVMAGGFAVGGIVLALKARWTSNNFAELFAGGEASKVWIEVVHA